MKKQTKHDMIIASLSAPDGVTLETLMKSTAWKEHSVRGYLSNLRNKKGFEINTTIDHNGDRIYQLASKG
jgi:hypothetical protein